MTVWPLIPSLFESHENFLSANVTFQPSLAMGRAGLGHGHGHSGLKSDILSQKVFL
jgi:hypothetical protein